MDHAPTFDNAITGAVVSGQQFRLPALCRPLFVFAADLHMQPCAWKSRRTLCGDALNSFEQLLSVAAYLKVPLVLGGDIFDSKTPDPATLAQAGVLLRNSSGLPALYYVQGDHDRTNPPWLSLLGDPRVRYVSGTSDVLQDGSVYALDWDTPTAYVESLATIPDSAKILITHQYWDELMTGARVNAVSRVSLSSIPRHINHLFTGDMHRTATIAKPSQADWLNIYSPGSTCMQSIDEWPDKYAFIVTHSPANLGVIPYKLATRPVFRYVLADEGQLRACLGELERLADIYRYPTTAAIVDIAYTDGLPGIEAVSNYDRQLHLFTTAIASMASTEAAKPPATLETYQTAVINRLTATNPAAAALAPDLLSAADPAAFLQRAFDHYLHTAGSA